MTTTYSSLTCTSTRPWLAEVGSIILPENTVTRLDQQILATYSMRGGTVPHQVWCEATGSTNYSLSLAIFFWANTQTGELSPNNNSDPTWAYPRNHNPRGGSGYPKVEWPTIIQQNSASSGSTRVLSFQSFAVPITLAYQDIRKITLALMVKPNNTDTITQIKWGFFITPADFYVTFLS